MPILDHIRIWEDQALHIPVKEDIPTRKCREVPQWDSIHEWEYRRMVIDIQWLEQDFLVVLHIFSQAWPILVNKLWLEAIIHGLRWVIRYKVVFQEMFIQDRCIKLVLQMSKITLV